MTDIPRARLYCAALLAAFVALLLPVAPAVAASGAPIVHTRTGVLRGLSAQGVQHFLGVPYARPPVGEARWRAPQPVERWRGVRDATAYGNRCPATASTNGPRSETEDCLYLNVQRPAQTRPGQRLPVYVWIHGGGLQNGSSNQHDGSLIVRETGVIVVTVNYRLGVFGFLAHPDLTRQEGESGNYGLLDQRAALRWVRDNVSAFGGDPRQVTVGGESAGGFSVCAHLTAPDSRGLFARAVIQSGSCPSRTLAQAEAAGATYASAAGCPDVACLRALPAGDLLDRAPYAPSFVHGVPSLPENPDTAVLAGRFARVPLIVGSTRDEGRTFSQGFVGRTREQYTDWVRTTYGGRADAVLAQYPWPADADRFTPAYLVGAIMTDSGLVAGLGGCPTIELIRTFAASTRTYGYRFDHRTGPGLAPRPEGYVWGAGHAAELAYHWPSFDNGTPIAPTFDAAERRLALDMVRYWGAFIRGGHPAARHATTWPAFNRSGLIMSLRAGGASVPVPASRMAGEHRCDFWNAT